VLAVVPGKECLAMASGVFDAAKAFREVVSVFHGLELVLCPSKFKERHASTSQFHLERL